MHLRIDDHGREVAADPGGADSRGRSAGIMSPDVLTSADQHDGYDHDEIMNDDEFVLEEPRTARVNKTVQSFTAKSCSP